ncbi:MAG: hypothetical protein WBE34_12960 [Candidatus Nitrosopolaris sp.]
MKAAALATKDDKNGLACERLLPDTPENAYMKCLSEALFNDDIIAALKCAKLLPQSTQQTTNKQDTFYYSSTSNSSSKNTPCAG